MLYDIALLFGQGRRELPECTRPRIGENSEALHSAGLGVTGCIIVLNLLMLLRFLYEKVLKCSCAQQGPNQSPRGGLEEILDVAYSDQARRQQQSGRRSFLRLASQRFQACSAAAVCLRQDGGQMVTRGILAAEHVLSQMARQCARPRMCSERASTAAGPRTLVCYSRIGY